MWFLSFLQDDIPPIYPTSPGPVPITLAMEHVVLKRSDDGVFHIGGELGSSASWLLCLFPPRRREVITRNCLHVGSSLLFRTLTFPQLLLKTDHQLKYLKVRRGSPPKNRIFWCPQKKLLDSR